MSEYQYYEFRAVDRPLTPDEMRALRAVSSRARIAPTRFVNWYNYGDFKGDPAKWMDRYFDAFLYLANWGTRQVMFRLPAGLLDAALAARYCRGDAAAARVTESAVILDFGSDDDSDDSWSEDGSGLLSSILPVRAELAAGDVRPLYLAWLLSAQEGDLDDDDVEPPVPPGLGELTAAQKALADFLRIDEDVIAVAAERSAPMPAAPTAAEVRGWIAALPDEERIGMLVRVAAGQEARVRAELNRGASAGRYPGTVESAAHPPRTVRELLDGSEVAATARHTAEQERAAREKEDRERAAAEAHNRYLDDLATRVDAVWTDVETLVASARAAGYDEAVQQLAGLRDLATRDGTADLFKVRVEQLRARHPTKAAFHKRLTKQGL